MKIISLWNPKGGQGKSLIALNLAAAAHAQGKNAVVICRDPLGTSTLYHNKGNLPFEVLPAYPMDKPDLDFLIVDHPADDWIMPPSPIVIVPAIPERTQYASFRDALTFLEEQTIENNTAPKHIIRVVTNTDYHVLQQVQIAGAMTRAGAFEIRRGASLFTTAAEEYRTIFDSAKQIRTAYGVKDRRYDFNTILKATQRAAKTQTQKLQRKELAHA